MEKVVDNQVHGYLINNEMLSGCQSGFRPLNSIASAFLNVTDIWLHVIDKENIVGLVMIDLKRAFDTVDHCILLQK